MEKVETEVQEVHIMTGDLAAIFRVLSNPDAVKILYCAGDGIGNSTYAMEELDLTQKRFYTRLRALFDAHLITKKNRVYHQTELGRIMYERFLPAMQKTVDAKDKLELLEQLKGTELENSLKKSILDELGIPDFTDSTNLKLLGDYEALAIEAIDLYDSAKENVILATNHFDVRVIEAFLRGVDRGVTNRVIMGKNRSSSMIQNLGVMLSLTFSKTLINFASNIEKLKNTVMFAELPYTFCVVDGHHSLIEFADPLNDRFIAALSVDDRDVAEKLTKFYETLWDTGETHSTFKALNSIKSS